MVSPGLLACEITLDNASYYLHNQIEVDAYLNRLDNWREQRYQEWKANPSPVVERLRTLNSERTTLTTIPTLST
ncbi:hypothetical protein KFU94_43155 [Chloroflexi bacterium TSY]|nr:hypothetical protein [Chloroflexi bacterium TSY]